MDNTDRVSDCQDTYKTWQACVCEKDHKSMVKRGYLNAMAYATNTISKVNESDMQRLLNILRLS